jgi:uncharacterized repeat protein (TIGR03803 family)
MGHSRRSVRFRTSAVAGLVIALALPLTRSAGAVPGAAGGAIAAPGFTLSVVHQFPAALQTTPKYLALSKDGNLYGATSAVGSSNGTVFRLSGGSVYTTLATLDYARDGGPFGAPFLGTGGLLYGLTFDGGRTGIGSIYTVKPDGTITTVLAFNGTTGMYPTALVQAPDGTLYGTTYYGGSHGDGNAYKLSPGGTFTNIVSCTLHSCLYPIALVLAADGNVYGISEGDKQGFGNNGQLFAITPKFRTEVNFNTTVADRPWNLELGRNGSLYGLTQDFYTYRSHFFRFTPPATLTFLGSYHFPGSGAFGPQIQAPDGNFYGTLMGDIHHPGWVYQLTPTGAFHLVATFGGKDGAQPDELALGADGSLYGTTESGGATGGGVIFRLTLPH